MWRNPPFPYAFLLNRCKSLMFCHRLLCSFCHNFFWRGGKKIWFHMFYIFSYRSHNSLIISSNTAAFQPPSLCFHMFKDDGCRLLLIPSLPLSSSSFHLSRHVTGAATSCAVFRAPCNHAVWPQLAHCAAHLADLQPHSLLQAPDTSL